MGRFRHYRNLDKTEDRLSPSASRLSFRTSSRGSAQRELGRLGSGLTMAPSPEWQGPVSPALFTPVVESADRVPRLCVVVDTEEEFDWTAPFSRDNVSVTAIAEVGRLQSVLTPYRLKPTYLVDYPVAVTASSADRLSEIAGRDECQIGAHLHPWVNPPYTESGWPAHELRLQPGARARAELRSQDVAQGDRRAPGPRGRFLQGRAIRIRPLHRSDPRDTRIRCRPQRQSPHGFHRRRRTDLRGLRAACRRCSASGAACSSCLARRDSSAPHDDSVRDCIARRRRGWLEPFRAVGVLARTGVLNKVMLSPEGNTFTEMQTLTDTLYAAGVRTFSLTMHSPSFKPGCTPYVRSIRERDDFLATIDRYCDYFMNRLGGVPSTPADVFDDVSKRVRPSSRGDVS